MRHEILKAHYPILIGKRLPRKAKKFILPRIHRSVNFPSSTDTHVEVWTHYTACFSAASYFKYRRYLKYIKRKKHPVVFTHGKSWWEGMVIVDLEPVKEFLPKKAHL